MDGSTVTLDMARDALKRAMEVQGRDFVYNLNHPGAACFYAPALAYSDDDPRKKTGCLVGETLAVLGFEGSQFRQAHGRLVDMLAYDLTLKDEVAKYLQVAQDSQDRGASWGAAYDRAEGSLHVGTCTCGDSGCLSCARQAAA